MEGILFQTKSKDTIILSLFFFKKKKSARELIFMVFQAFPRSEETGKAVPDGEYRHILLSIYVVMFV